MYRSFFPKSAKRKLCIFKEQLFSEDKSFLSHLFITTLFDIYFINCRTDVNLNEINILIGLLVYMFNGVERAIVYVITQIAK